MVRIPMSSPVRRRPLLVGPPKKITEKKRMVRKDQFDQNQMKAQMLIAILKVRISVRKLKKLDDPEARLRRAVLINNTLLCLRKNDQVDKGKTDFGGSEVLPTSSEYRTNLEKALPGGGGLCWGREEEKSQWRINDEKDEWKVEDQLKREEEQEIDGEHLRGKEHLREEQFLIEDQMEDKVREEELSKEAEERLQDCDNEEETLVQQEHDGGERLQADDRIVDEEGSSEGGTCSSLNRLALPPYHCQYYLPSLSPTFYGHQLSRLVCSMES